MLCIVHWGILSDADYSSTFTLLFWDGEANNMLHILKLEDFFLVPWWKLNSKNTLFIFFWWCKNVYERWAGDPNSRFLRKVKLFGMRQPGRIIFAISVLWFKHGRWWRDLSLHTPFGQSNKIIIFTQNVKLTVCLHRAWISKMSYQLLCWVVVISPTASDQSVSCTKGSGLIL